MRAHRPLHWSMSGGRISPAFASNARRHRRRTAHCRTCIPWRLSCAFRSPAHTPFECRANNASCHSAHKRMNRYLLISRRQMARDITRQEVCSSGRTTGHRSCRTKRQTLPSCWRAQPGCVLPLIKADAFSIGQPRSERTKERDCRSSGCSSMY